MFADLLQLFTRREAKADDYEHAFVKDVAVTAREPRSVRSEKLLVFGWVLIAAKCVLTWWAVDAYKVPVNEWWIIAPTVFMAMVCTVLYLRRR